MNITLHNYEEFFLLYADKELSAEERLAVEQFVEAHPDLKAELEMIQQTILPQSNEVFFPDKESLFRTTDTDNLVNLTNYESYFVQYTDDELSNEEKAATELFVYKHPECQEEFELIQKARLEPDTQIQFPDKNLLYRSTREAKPVIAIWFRYAAAAILLLLAGMFWLQQQSNQPHSTPQPVASKENSPAGKVPVPALTVPENQLAKTDVAQLPEKKPESVQHKRMAPAPRIQQPAEEHKIIPAPAPKELLASKEEPGLQPAAVQSVASHDLPREQLTVPVVQDKAVTSAPIFTNQAAKEDYIYVANEPASVKKPLRGLLRKASRFVEQNNPLTAEHKKGGVFTASNEQ